MSGPKGTIVVADDEETARTSLGEILREDGYDVRLAADGEEALALVARTSPDILLTDLRMPKLGGEELLDRVRKGSPDVAVVLMTAHGTIASAVRALRAGAEDYLTKPIDVEELEHLLAAVLARRRLASEARLLRERLDDKYRFENIIGRSPAMIEVFRLVEQVAPSPASVLITGESGTGKELIAQAIHQRSPRREAPFVKVSCAALPETLLESELFGHERGAFTGAVARRAGRFEIAAGGTVLLDEIGDVPLGMQVKLLRFLQERQFERLGGNQTQAVDVRVIAATHQDLQARILDGKFREDLYYRLNVVEIAMPPLRGRAEDIPLLAEFFLRKYAETNRKPIEGLAPEALALLNAASWPGNVRQLEHAIERAIILTRGPWLGADLFPGLVSEEARQAPSGDAGPPVPGSSLDDIERDAIVRTMESVGGSVTRAAAILKISPRAIQYKMKRYREAGAVGRPAGEEQDDNR
ncbi:MAG TPA: sigma-54 dependent transcriptional regulator [Candidatus Polarisedimenticolia bacterium]|nr:sigma-54 dependent transcriptional regulator [Candidatus Polarisedimenticolia bacterium]